MNIFEISDEEFEKYLKEKFDNINPEELLNKLVECGLIIENNTINEKEREMEVDNQ